MKRLARLLALVLFLPVSLIRAQEPGIKMQGHVIDAETSHPLSGVAVQAVGDQGIATATTDGDGLFILKLSPAMKVGDAVRIRFEKHGYKPLDKQVPASSEVTPLYKMFPIKSTQGNKNHPCSVSVVVTSDIIARVHLRAMWLPSGSTEVYKPIFQDLFHDWAIKVTPRRTTSEVIISILDARSPLDNIRVVPPEIAVVSKTKPGWLSGFSEPAQTPDFYVRTVSFATLDGPTTITIRRPIKSRGFGVNAITSLDLDFDRQVRASAEQCNVTVTPLSTVSNPLSSANPHFNYLTDQLNTLLKQTVSGSGFTTRLDPDKPYPPLAVNESEMIEEIKCKDSPCKNMTVELKEKTRLQ
jgi:hypothetical protein